MQEKVKEISSRVKELRELSDISLKEMAERLQVTEEYLTAFEEGNGDISASKLYEISQILGVDLSLLLTGESPKMRVFTVTRAGKGASVDRRRQYKYQALAQNFVDKKAEPFLVEIPSKGEDAEVSLNSHPGQEWDYVLDGMLKIVIHNNTVILNPGDSIFYDSNNPHGMAAIGDKPAKILAVIMS